jgi:hypothetical protein
VLKPIQTVQKLTGLPDRELLDIMTILYRKERRLCINVLMRPTEAPETSTPTSMVIVSKYELIENPSKGVFC